MVRSKPKKITLILPQNPPLIVSQTRNEVDALKLMQMDSDPVTQELEQSEEEEEAEEEEEEEGAEGNQESPAVKLKNGPHRKKRMWSYSPNIFTHYQSQKGLHHQS